MNFRNIIPKRFILAKTGLYPAFSAASRSILPMGHIGENTANFINHIRLKNGKPIPQQQGVRVTKRSEVIAFPAKNRVRDIKRCVEMLERLHGVEADRFWREECRALAAHLIGLGYDEMAMRQGVMEFQDAVQMQLWSQSHPEEAVRL